MKKVILKKHQSKMIFVSLSSLVLTLMTVGLLFCIMRNEMLKPAGGMLVFSNPSIMSEGLNPKLFVLGALIATFFIILLTVNEKTLPIQILKYLAFVIGFSTLFGLAGSFMVTLGLVFFCFAAWFGYTALLFAKKLQYPLCQGILSTVIALTCSSLLAYYFAMESVIRILTPS